MAFPLFDEDRSLQQAVEQSLQDIATQMHQPITPAVAEQFYQEAAALLCQVDYAPITLARVAGTLLVYQSQKLQPEELAWFKSQVRAATEAEEVEELIESMHRRDAL